MPQSSGSLPSPIALRSAMTRSTRGCILKPSGIWASCFESAFSVFSGTFDS